MGDIVISSLHKTLPALTQTAVVNVYNEKWIVPVKRYMDIFETSSPSYVLMSSVSRMLEILRKQQTDLFSSLYLNLKRLYTMELTHLKLLQTEDKMNDILSDYVCRRCLRSKNNGYRCRWFLSCLNL